MFLFLPLLNTCSNGGIVVYWMLSRKRDKPRGFDMNNSV